MRRVHLMARHRKTGRASRMQSRQGVRKSSMHGLKATRWPANDFRSSTCMFVTHRRRIVCSISSGRGSSNWSRGFVLMGGSNVRFKAPCKSICNTTTIYRRATPPSDCCASIRCSSKQFHAHHKLSVGKRACCIALLCQRANSPRRGVRPRLLTDPL